jgi:hypothetical protein
MGDNGGMMKLPNYFTDDCILLQAAENIQGAYTLVFEVNKKDYEKANEYVGGYAEILLKDE